MITKEYAEYLKKWCQFDTKSIPSQICNEINQDFIRWVIRKIIFISFEDMMSFTKVSLQRSLVKRQRLLKNFLEARRYFLSRIFRVHCRLIQENIVLFFRNNKDLLEQLYIFYKANKALFKRRKPK